MQKHGDGNFRHRADIYTLNLFYILSYLIFSSLLYSVTSRDGNVTESFTTPSAQTSSPVMETY